MKFDLHLHTSASDGTDTPTQLVELAAKGGFSLVAITDHDTMAGVEEALRAGERLGVRVIPGVEISAGGEGEDETHVLGYGVTQREALEAALREMRALRSTRMEQMVRRLNGMGIPVSLSKVLGSAKGSVGRAHLARQMVAEGEARDVRDAFNRYLSPGRPAYVPRQKLTLVETLKLITRCGGAPVIAHPGQHRADLFWMDERVRALIPSGLAGIEAYHPAHGADTCDTLERLARRYGLLVTGGSDYHGAVKQIRMGEGMAAWRRADEDLERLLRRIHR